MKLIPRDWCNKRAGHSIVGSMYLTPPVPVWLVWREKRTLLPENGMTVWQQEKKQWEHIGAERGHMKIPSRKKRLKIKCIWKTKRNAYAIWQLHATSKHVYNVSTHIQQALNSERATNTHTHTSTVRERTRAGAGAGATAASTLHAFISIIYYLPETEIFHQVNSVGKQRKNGNDLKMGFISKPMAQCTSNWIGRIPFHIILT